MSSQDTIRLTRPGLLQYFLDAATPRAGWQVGMELEKMGRNATTGAPLPYDGADPSVRRVLEFLRSARGGAPVLEADNLIGIDGDWGTVSLEPGGQVEWSSRPCRSLDGLEQALNEHLRTMRRCSQALGVDWLDESVDPETALERMPWMPKARYNIMRSYLGSRGRLAHRMMTQTASIQCAFDYEDPTDWRRKFKAGALLAPLATALFANSRRIDGEDTGHANYRQAIWRETDPDRCGLPASLFEANFTLESWLEYVLATPTIFLHRARGLIPAGGVPFGRLMRRRGCTALGMADWETHLSTLFTDVRCYTYIEVRSADLQSDELALSVPAFWTGILYGDDALDAALDLGQRFDSHERWSEAMVEAARHGLDGRDGTIDFSELAAEALSISIRALDGGVPCAGDGAGAAAVRRLAAHRHLELAA